MTKDVKITIKPKLMQALYGDVTPALEQQLNKMVHNGGVRPQKGSDPETSFNPNPKFKPRKKAISIRMDVDVLDWFKAQPGKYQKLINKACRAYMHSAKKEVEV